MTAGPVAETVAPGVLRLTAPNPGPMTGPGTNSYIVGTGPCVILDPGVDDAAHLAALENAAPGDIVAVLVTHAHPDHTGGARRLAERLNVPVRGCDIALERPYDPDYRVDEALADGDTLRLGELTLEAVHTPGHAADHLCFYVRESKLLLAGDTVMADVTVVILPPDGSMSDYLASIERLQAMAIAAIAPGHGRRLDDPAATFAHILSHRLEREAQVRAALADGATGAEAIAARLYPDLDPRLRGMAATQVEAHLIRLAERGEAERAGTAWRTL